MLIFPLSIRRDVVFEVLNGSLLHVFGNAKSKMNNKMNNSPGSFILFLNKNL